MNAPIVDEVRRVRDAHAARFNYGLDAIYRDIKEQEKKSGLTFVSFVPVQGEPRRMPQQTGAAPPITQRSGLPNPPPAAEIER